MATEPVPGTFLDAAVTVLRDAGRPLTVQEITDEAAKKPATGIVRLHEPGEMRARRGAVRWTLTRGRL